MSTGLCTDHSLSHFAYAVICFFFLQGCSGGQQVNRDEIAREMESRELKRVTPFQITKKGMEIGDSLANHSEGKLKSELRKVLDSGGVEKGIPLCKIYMDASVQKVGDARIAMKRVSSKNRNPENKPDSLEALILGAYEYGFETKATLDPMVQETGSEYVLYARPILITSALCLSCHGRVGKGISESDYDIINSLYIDDRAIDYEIGDLRGMWSIRIPKKLIVQSL